MPNWYLFDFDSLWFFSALSGGFFVIGGNLKFLIFFFLLFSLELKISTHKSEIKSCDKIWCKKSTQKISSYYKKSPPHHTVIICAYYYTIIYPNHLIHSNDILTSIALLSRLLLLANACWISWKMWRLVQFKVNKAWRIWMVKEKSGVRNLFDK